MMEVALGTSGAQDGDETVGGGNGDADMSLIYFKHCPSYQEFFQLCLLPNRPCLLPASLLQDWKVIRSKAWSRTEDIGAEEEDGCSVDWDRIAQDYGQHSAPVVISRLGQEDERKDMTIREAVDRIKDLKRRNHGRYDNIDASIYIKDWHLIRQLRKQHQDKAEQEEPYKVPAILADDWMNNLPKPKALHESETDLDPQEDQDDFRFVYAGTKGSKTLLHRDVYTSYSWSANVVGKKKWYFFPPWVIPHLRKYPAIETSELVPDICTLQGLLRSSQTGPSNYPNLHLAWQQVQIVIQNPSETIFVPSNWYHQVENLTDCVSINRNWCNSVNIPNLYLSIKQELSHVQDSLRDVKEMLQDQARSQAQTHVHVQDQANMVTYDSEQGHDTAASSWQREFTALVQDLAVKDAGWAWLGFWKMVERNLHSPPTQQQLRPPNSWVKDRILPLLQDFRKREETKDLDRDIIAAAEACRALLDGIAS